MTTQSSKQHLIAAINALPSDNVLSDARRHLKTALNEIEHVEKKRLRSQVTQASIAKEWEAKIEQNIKKGIGHPVAVAAALKRIEQMIKDEEVKVQKTSIPPKLPLDVLLS